MNFLTCKIIIISLVLSMVFFSCFPAKSIASLIVLSNKVFGVYNIHMYTGNVNHSAHERTKVSSFTHKAYYLGKPQFIA